MENPEPKKLSFRTLFTAAALALGVIFSDRAIKVAQDFLGKKATPAEIESAKKEFPAAEDYLAAEGIDPAIAAKLGGPSIRIVPRDKLSLYINLLSQGGSANKSAASSLYYFIVDPFNAVSANKEDGFQFFIPEFKDDVNCIVIAPNARMTALQEVSNNTYIGPSFITHLPVSDRENFFIGLFHELGHCHPANAHHPFREGDTEYRAAGAAARIFNNEAIPDFTLYFRAGPTRSREHDISLYLDNLYNTPSLLQQPLPLEPTLGRAYAMAAPALEGLPLLSLTLDHLDSGSPPPFMKIVDAYEKALADPGQKLSSLMKKRLNLYLDAVRYFAPESMKDHPASAPRPSS